MQALGAAREEVRSALATAEKVLEHLDAARRFEGVVIDGPQGDNLDAFVMALEKLDEASSFLTRHKSGLVAAAAAVESVDALRNDGNVLALREFESTLKAVPRQHGLAAEPKRGEKNGKTITGARAPGAAATEKEEHPTATAAAAVAAAAAQRRRLRLLAGALVAGGNEAASSCVKTYFELRNTVIDAAIAAESMEHKQQIQQQQAMGVFLVDSRRRARRCVFFFVVFVSFFPLLKKKKKHHHLKARFSPTSPHSICTALTFHRLLDPNKPFIRRRWCDKLRTLVRVAFSEKELAAAIFTQPHRDAAYHSVVAAAVNQVVGAGQSAVSARREPDKVRKKTFCADSIRVRRKRPCFSCFFAL